MSLCERGHDFGPPVIVSAVERSSSFFFIERESFERTMEKAVSICRRCGANVIIGWSPKEEDE